MQRRTLIRTRTLAGFRAALVDLARPANPIDARRRVVIVPTRASAELLRQTIEAAAERAGAASVVLPDLLTRDEWMAALRAALPDAPPWLSRIDRETILERAARRAAARSRSAGRPFHLRPGLVAAMLEFYDELHRRQRPVRRFARALFDQLRGERGTDRGSDSLIQQTTFLGFAFLAYERGVAASGGLDEHALRRQLLARQPGLPVDHVVVAVADHPSDPRGLWPADFDLLGRLQGLARIDVVLTDETHDAGLRERLEQELPGIEEFRRDPATEARPVLIAPGGPAGSVCIISRDREDELREVVRRIRGRAQDGVLGEPVAVVFERRLPYLYLARDVFEDGGVPYQSFDALPLASEPWAALLDLVLTFARTGGTRESAVALLRSRMLRFDVDGAPVGRRDVAALDVCLRERRSTGEADTYRDEVSHWFGDRDTREQVDRTRAVRAARAAAAVHDALRDFRTGARASAQIAVLSSLLTRAQRLSAEADPEDDRAERARAAVLGVLDGLAGAYRRVDDEPRATDDLVAAIHHAIEARTFSTRRGRAGVHLVDAVAARFGEFDHVHIVGLVDADWPERSRRSIFYSPGLLGALGWPQPADRQRAQFAAFRDLLGLAARTVSLHAFQLEGDAIVAPSPLAEAARGLRATDEGPVRVRLFADEVLTSEVPVAWGAGEPAAWLALRRERPPIDTPAYAGRVGPIAALPVTSARPSSGYRVSRVDRYVDCPFKYFAESVLGLPEERDEMAGLTPLERGNLVHELFEAFYRRWQADGQGTITRASLPHAVERFAEVTRDRLARLPDADRVLEEARLLGSIVSRGLAERVFELEADEGGEVTDRLLETDLRGSFTFPLLAGLRQREIEVRGKADRIDLFHDGSFRVVDYKLGRLPDEASIQIGVYAHCARQWLERRDGRPHRVRAAMYLAFGDDRQLEGAMGSSSEPVEIAVDARASAFAGYVEQIEAGEFPARPRRTSYCTHCRFAGVCRKEYQMAPEAEAGGDD